MKKIMFNDRFGQTEAVLKGRKTVTPIRVDMIGRRFSRLKVIAISHKGLDRQYYYKCQCDCGNITVVRSNALTCGNTKSCGCLSKGAIKTYAMIQANELRLGNWVYNSTTDMFPMQVVNIGSDYVYLDFKDNEGDVWEPYMKELCGIPLTEELLLKCDFQKQDSECEKECPDYYEWLERSFPIIGCVYQCDTKDHLLAELNGTELHIHYLHQLQNLYYALTGKELEITL